MNMLKARQVAELIGVGRTTVYSLAANGVIPSYKIGKGAVRFDAEEVAAFIRSCRRNVANHRQIWIKSSSLSLRDPNCELKKYFQLHGLLLGPKVKLGAKVSSSQQ